MFGGELVGWTMIAVLWSFYGTNDDDDERSIYEAMQLFYDLHNLLAVFL